VKTGIFPALLEPGNECRCPDSTPSVITDMDKYGLKCTTSSSDSTQDRLNPESHLPVFAVDGNVMTSWITGTVTDDAWIKLAFNDIYQVNKRMIACTDYTYQLMVNKQTNKLLHAITVNLNLNGSIIIPNNSNYVSQIRPVGPYIYH